MPAATLAQPAPNPGHRHQLMKLRRTCQEVTRLVLLWPEQAPSLTARLSMRLHWLACSNCARFRDQSRQLRGALDRWRRYRED